MCEGTAVAVFQPLVGTGPSVPAPHHGLGGLLRRVRLRLERERRSAGVAGLQAAPDEQAIRPLARLAVAHRVDLLQTSWQLRRHCVRAQCPQIGEHARTSIGCTVASSAIHSSPGSAAGMPITCLLRACLQTQRSVLSSAGLPRSKAHRSRSKAEWRQVALSPPPPRAGMDTSRGRPGSFRHPSGCLQMPIEMRMTRWRPGLSG